MKEVISGAVDSFVDSPEDPESEIKAVSSVLKSSLMFSVRTRVVYMSRTREFPTVNCLSGPASVPASNVFRLCRR